MISIKTILCPVDFFPASNRALDYAAKLAACHGAAIHLLNVVTPGAKVAYYPLTTAEYSRSGQIGLRSFRKHAGARRPSGILPGTTASFRASERNGPSSAMPYSRVGSVP
jgi:hypothetical protein